MSEDLLDDFVHWGGALFWVIPNDLANKLALFFLSPCSI
jgi:hypothetical protein